MLEKFIDLLIDRIIAFSDYFIVKKHITLSETALFAFSFMWSLWFSFVGLYISNAPLTRSVWLTLFGMSTLAHFISFFFNDVRVRALVVSGYAFIWCFLALLTLFTGSVAPAFPTLIVMMFLSVFLAVRLFREKTS